MMSTDTSTDTAKMNVPGLTMTTDTDFYICEFCNYSTNRLVTFTAHISKCSEKFPNSFSCSKCIYQSRDFTEFQEHCKTHIVSTKFYNCQTCSFVSISQIEFNQHISCCSKRNSADGTEIAEPVEKRSNEFDCEECEFYCNTSLKFEQHMSARHSVVWDYSCFHCNYKVQSYSLFSMHISRYHPELLAAEESDEKEADKPSNLIQCLHCAYQSESQIKVHEHMKIDHSPSSEAHVPNKRIKLDNAGSLVSDKELQFPTEGNIVKVTPRARGAKKYACSECPYKTNGHALFVRHQKAHSSPISFHCNICPYKTISRTLVLKHMKNSHPLSQMSQWKMYKDGTVIEDGVLQNDYKCDQCSYHTNKLLSLRNHKKVHALIRQPIKCCFCHFTTRNTYLMNKHVAFRHPELDTNDDAADLNKSDSPLSKPGKSPTLFKFSKCEDCGFIAKHYKTLEKHIEAHNSEFHYKCPHCLFINTCFKTFRVHMNKFHPKEKILIKRNPLEKYEYQCETCNYETNSQEKLVKHKIDHEEGKFFHCEICNYIAVSLLKLGKHTKLKHPQTLLKKCQHCEYTTNRTRNYKSHLQAHKDPEAYKCEHCFFLSSSYRTFCTHMSSRHPDELNTTNDHSLEASPSKTSDDLSTPDNMPRLAHKCDQCLFSTTREAVLEVHIRTHGSEKCMKCEHCYFLTTHKYSLEKHLSEKHSIKKLYSCTKCSFTTKRMQYYRNHTKAHDNKYAYQCSFCEFICLSYTTYMSHMRNNHPGEEMQKEKKPGEMEEEKKPGEMEEEDELDEDDDDSSSKAGGYSCEQCSFTTNNPKSMESHAKAHESEKAIKCEICEYMTLSFSSYKSHVKNNHPHSKLKSKLYQCSKCDYSTGSGPSFKSHTRAHASENNYSCEYCPYLTVFYHSICVHMAKNHPEKENTFVKHGAREGYYQKEKKEYKYYCILCPFRCMYYKLYKNHIELMHPGAKDEYQEYQDKLKKSKESNTYYFCKNCDFQTDISGDMEEHLTSHPPDVHYMCALCSFQSLDKDMFDIHVVEQHQASPTAAESTTNFYICPCCAFKTQSLDTYNMHLVAHPLKEKANIEIKLQARPKDGQYKATCEICGYVTVNSKRLVYHMIAHQSKEAYDCEHCKYKTINRQSYRKHVKLSHGIILPLGRPLKKPGAEASPPTNTKIITVTEKYRCKDCGFESSSISAYNHHMDAHMATNSFKCPHCLYRTVRWVNLKSHLIRTHPEMRTKRDEITPPQRHGPVFGSPSSSVTSSLFSTPTMFGGSASSSLGHTPTFPTMADTFMSEPVMMPRDDLLSEQVVSEEIISMDDVGSWTTFEGDEDICF